MLRDVVRVIRTETAAGAGLALPGQRARRPRQPPDGRPHHRGGVRAGRRSERFPSRSRKACGRGSRSRSTSAACAKTRTGPCASIRGEYSPWLGDVVRRTSPARSELPALAEQRPARPGAGAATTATTGASARGMAAAPAKEAERSSMASTRRYSGPVQRRCGRASRRRRRPARRAIDGAVDAAIADFTMTDPSAAVPGAGARPAVIREAIAKSRRRGRGAVRAAHKEQQFVDAITACLGVDLTAVAQPAGTPSRPGRSRRSRRRRRWRRRFPARPSRCGRACQPRPAGRSLPAASRSRRRPGWTVTPAATPRIAPSADEPPAVAALRRERRRRRAAQHAARISIAPGSRRAATRSLERRSSAGPPRAAAGGRGPLRDRRCRR